MIRALMVQILNLMTQILILRQMLPLRLPLLLILMLMLMLILVRGYFQIRRQPSWDNMAGSRRAEEGSHTAR
jgi:FlaA1/EpsC-like NDP-sugar epimerase